jgi:hypothetical protein
MLFRFTPFALKNACALIPIFTTGLITNNIKYTAFAMSTLNNDQVQPSIQFEIDPIYPGTAVQRMHAIRERVLSLNEGHLNGEWPDVRRSILWAGGLRDLPTARPGLGYTGHSFNDFNHCDLTAMLDDVAVNENKGLVKGIAYSNQLGPGIKIASIEELGPGGSWSTCMMGCNQDPPQDVAHLQFRSRIAFKLIWVPKDFTSFVLVDDNGELLAHGHPTGSLPSIHERMQNYALVAGSKYAVAADQLAAEASNKT